MVELTDKLQLFAKVQARPKDEISSAAKVVFGCLLLTHHSTKTGICNPGYPCLVKNTGHSKQTIIAAVRQLKKAGVLDFEENAGGAHKATNSYRFPGLDPADGSRTGQKSGRVKNLDATGQKDEGDGSNPSTPRVKSFDPNQEANQESNQEPNTARAQAHDAWAGFDDEVLGVLRAARYGSLKGGSRSGTWRNMGYDPALCLEVIKEKVSGNREIRSLRWFDRPIEKAHRAPQTHLGIFSRTNTYCDASTGGVTVIMTSERIYEETEEGSEWLKHEAGFRMVNTDARLGKRYAVRSTRWPPGSSRADVLEIEALGSNAGEGSAMARPAADGRHQVLAELRASLAAREERGRGPLKDAANVAAELEVIAEGRGRR